jgi:hypothetical protein
MSGKTTGGGLDLGNVGHGWPLAAGFWLYTAFAGWGKPKILWRAGPGLYHSLTKPQAVWRKGASVMRFLGALLIWIWASAAFGGAWPREKGQIFFALSSDQTRAKISAEYGLGRDWTLGAEATQGEKGRLPALSVFLMHPVWRGSGGAIVSAGIGAAYRETYAAGAYTHLQGTPEIAASVRLSWGMGFGSRWGDGWYALDAQVEKVMSEDWALRGLTYKLDATIGLKPHDRVMVMVQAQGWASASGERVLRLEPSAAFALGKVQLVVAPSIGVIGAADPRLKLAVWLTF